MSRPSLVPSSRGLGRRPLKPETAVQIRSGLLVRVDFVDNEGMVSLLWTVTDVGTTMVEAPDWSFIGGR